MNRLCWFAVMLAALMAFSVGSRALAVEAGEQLKDPALEKRARDLSAELRCLVCQNQSIDDSNAELAKDLRLLVRERISAGDTNREVLDYVVSRYGEFVLLRPPFNVKTLMLWLAPVLLLLVGGWLVVWRLTGTPARASGPETVPLDSEEQRRLSELLNQKSSNDARSEGST